MIEKLEELLPCQITAGFQSKNCIISLKNYLVKEFINNDQLFENLKEVNEESLEILYFFYDFLN